MRIKLGFLTAALLSTTFSAMAADMPGKGLAKVEHIVVIYLENHSFDNLYGLFPGADSLVGPGARWLPQVDKDGQPYGSLPSAMMAEGKNSVPDLRFPKTLPNAPFLIDQYVPQNEKTSDLVHKFYQNQMQIDGGRNDKFAAISDAGGLTMGFYDTRGTKLWGYARKYTLADHFFMGAFGGSFLNHFWLVCGCTPKFDHAPDDLVAKLDAQGNLLKDGAVTPDGYAVNTLHSVNQPHSTKKKAEELLPLQTMPHIGDRLDEKAISWAWYSGGWNDALASKPDATFQYHHQPLAYFADLADGRAAKKAHLKDEADLYAAIGQGDLPAVTFYKPLGVENQHPGYANVTNGDDRAADVIAKIEHSPLWRSTVIIVTYDENGGFWDHISPPKGDRWGPGSRVPTLVISPFAKKGYVDHTVYDTTSILKLIENRFGLKPLGERDAKANDLTNALTFR